MIHELLYRPEDAVEWTKFDECDEEDLMDHLESPRIEIADRSIVGVQVVKESTATFTVFKKIRKIIQTGVVVDGQIRLVDSMIVQPQYIYHSFDWWVRTYDSDWNGLWFNTLPIQTHSHACYLLLVAHQTLGSDKKFIRCLRKCLLYAIQKYSTIDSDTVRQFNNIDRWLEKDIEIVYSGQTTTQIETCFVYLTGVIVNNNAIHNLINFMELIYETHFQTYHSNKRIDDLDDALRNIIHRYLLLTDVLIPISKPIS